MSEAARADAKGTEERQSALSAKEDIRNIMMGCIIASGRLDVVGMVGNE